MDPLPVAWDTTLLGDDAEKVRPEARKRICPQEAIGIESNPLKTGADSGNRTPDLLITNQLLYP